MSAAEPIEEPDPAVWVAYNASGKRRELEAVEIFAAVDEIVSRCRVGEHRVTVFASADSGAIVGAEIVALGSEKRYRIESAELSRGSER